MVFALHLRTRSRTVFVLDYPSPSLVVGIRQGNKNPSILESNYSFVSKKILKYYQSMLKNRKSVLLDLDFHIAIYYRSNFKI